MGSYAIWERSQFRVSNMAAAAALHAGFLGGGVALAVPPAVLLLWCATYSHRTASTAAALMRSRIQEALSDVYRRA